MIYSNVIIPSSFFYDLNLTNADYFSGYLALITPVKVYCNADTQKETIVKENKGKAGVYRWINNSNGNSYVGSSVDLRKRFISYYRYNYISDPKRNMLIHRAILKYGYSNFTLEILEYCDSPNTIEREQHYLDLLNPEYNILTKAGSSLGHKHSEETLIKFKARVRTKDHVAALTAHLAKHNASSEQRAKSRERMLEINKKKGFIVEVTNIESGEIVKYESIRQTATELNTSHVTIKNYIKNGKLFSGKYKIKILSGKV